MRNPFSRKRKLPGAKGEWDEAQHVPWGDDYVAIPVDQLPPDAEGQPGMTMEAMERLEGAKVYDFDDQGIGVMVNMTQVLKDVEQAAHDAGEVVEAKIDPDTGEFNIAGSPGFSEGQLEWAFYRAVNDTDNWADMDNVADAEGDAETHYSFMRIDLTTGFIGEPPE